jgi:hypothetical protein
VVLPGIGPDGGGGTRTRLNRLRPGLCAVVVGIFLVVGVPLIGSWVRRSGPHHCALDGLAIVPATAVRVTDSAGESHEFCCVRCAQRWLARTDSSAVVTVTDEVTGTDLDSRAAIFVRCPVVINPVTGNRIRVFREAADADAHVARYGGRVLGPDEWPFRPAE